MDIAVLADIHSNYGAFKKCIDYILSRNITTFIFLGDYVGELAYPQRTMELLYTLKDKYNCFFIKGNKENYWINYKKNGEQGWKDNDSTTGSLLYTYNNLTKRDISFFECLTDTQEILTEDMPALTICHGSPQKVNKKMLPGDENTFSVMESDKNSIILCGHTHMQAEIKRGIKRVLNPGSIGVPLHSDGKAQFLILHGENGSWNHDFISLEYDIEKEIAALYESGLNISAPYWCRITENLLRKGNISHGTVLARAMSLCSSETGECNWPDIPEKYWKQAVSEML